MKQVVLTFSFIFSIINVFCQTSEDFIKRGREKAKIGDYNGAIIEFNYAIKLDSFFVEGYRYRGYSKLKLKEYNEAIIDFSKAIAINSKDTFSLFYRGLSYQLNIRKNDFQNYRNAISDFAKVIDVNPNSVKSYLNKGICEFEMMKYDDAFNDLTKTIKLDKKFHGHIFIEVKQDYIV